MATIKHKTVRLVPGATYEPDESRETLVGHTVVIENGVGILVLHLIERIDIPSVIENPKLSARN